MLTAATNKIPGSDKMKTISQALGRQFKIFKSETNEETYEEGFKVKITLAFDQRNWYILYPQEAPAGNVFAVEAVKCA